MWCVWWLCHLNDCLSVACMCVSVVLCAEMKLDIVKDICAQVEEKLKDVEDERNTDEGWKQSVAVQPATTTKRLAREKKEKHKVRSVQTVFPQPTQSALSKEVEQLKALLKVCGCCEM